MCHYNYSVFIQCTTSGIAVLHIYVDDIVWIRSDTEVTEMKDYLKQHNVTKDIEKSRNFFEIGVAHQRNRLLVFQKTMCGIYCKRLVYLGKNLLAQLQSQMWIFIKKIVKFMIT